MESTDNIKNHAKKAISDELESLSLLASYIDDTFAGVVQLVLQCEGRLIVTGIGKSAIIGQKIVATLNSTGTPSLFMHAADAIHGDLGMIRPGEPVMAISKSGNTPEIQALVPLIKRMGNPLIAMVGKLDSTLAREADYVINTTVDREACPNNLAPTTSTTAQLLMGDAIAVALLSSRRFSSSDFGKFHPGGALGKMIFLTAGSMSSGNAVPSVEPQADIRRVIHEIGSKRLGATAVTENNRVLGVITDGDLRRMLEKSGNIEGIVAADIMNPNPVLADENCPALDIAEIMKEKKISQVIVTSNGLYKGMVHIHDLNREGII